MVSNRRTNLLVAAARRLGLVGDQDREDTGLSSCRARAGVWGEVQLLLPRTRTAPPLARN